MCRFKLLVPQKNIIVSCGKCDDCIKSKSAVWVTRMQLEQQHHNQSLFVTLTYNSQCLPQNNTLKPDDVTLFWKRLRKRLDKYNIKIRYFLVGEYGETRDRPHYHAIIFGIGKEFSKIIDQSWGKGFIYTGECNEKTIAYVANYATKKQQLNKQPNYDKNTGQLRHPVYFRSSNRYGIGYKYADNMIKKLNQVKDFEIDNKIVINNKTKTIGTYLFNRIKNGVAWLKKKAEKRLDDFKEKVSSKIKDYIETLPAKHSTTRLPTTWSRSVFFSLWYNRNYNNRYIQQPHYERMITNE